MPFRKGHQALRPTSKSRKLLPIHPVLGLSRLFDGYLIGRSRQVESQVKYRHALEWRAISMDCRRLTELRRVVRFSNIVYENPTMDEDCHFGTAQEPASGDRGRRRERSCDRRRRVFPLDELAGFDSLLIPNIIRGLAKAMGMTLAKGVRLRNPYVDRQEDSCRFEALPNVSVNSTEESSMTTNERSDKSSHPASERRGVWPGSPRAKSRRCSACNVHP